MLQRHLCRSSAMTVVKLTYVVLHPNKVRLLPNETRKCFVHFSDEHVRLSVIVLDARKTNTSFSNYVI